MIWMLLRRWHVHYSENHNPAMVEDFKENLSKPLSEIVKPCVEKYGRVRHWVQDETRLSLKTWLRRRITMRGVRPMLKTSGRRAGYSLYGAVEIKTGESFFLEGDRMNREGSGKFLKGFSEKNPMDFHVVQLDNASFHATKKLVLPDNMMLPCQPPYSPEVNPIEQVWGWLKGKMAGKIFSSLDELKFNAKEILSAKDNQFLNQSSIGASSWMRWARPGYKNIRIKNVSPYNWYIRPRPN